MAEQAIAVVDTNVVLTLATPVVDGRPQAPSGADPLEALLTGSESIWLANELQADLCITDEFNTTNYLFVALALDDRNVLCTTPHILCTLATHEILPVEYVDAALTERSSGARSSDARSSVARSTIGRPRIENGDRTEP